jgi:curved DNA-binding protein CbpA
MSSHYETLGISRTAKPEQIKRSYRRLVKRFHPDLFPAGSEAQAEAGERLRQIITAYAILSNAQKRLTYDARLIKRTSSYAEPKPEYCDKCGKPTLYWQIGRNIPLCDECGRTAR